MAVRVVDRLAPTFGVRIEVDVSEHSLAVHADELRELFDRHRLLAVSAPDLTREEQLRVVECLGTPVDDVQYVSNVRGDGGLAAQGELLFHNDLAFMPTPLEGITLYGQRVDSGAAGTRFIDCRAGYERLSDDLKRRLEFRQALHLWEKNHADRRIDLREVSPGGLAWAHPVFMEHPRSHERLLFVSQVATYCILGLSASDSDATLEELFAAQYQDEYLHEWSEGELLIWDNCALQHARSAVAADGPARDLRRIPFGDRASYERFAAASFRTVASSGREA